MARDQPDALELREIKYGPKSTAEQRSRAARSLLEAGRVAEALDLFLLAEDEEGVGEIRRRALDEGRPILLLMLQRAGRAIPAAEWRSAGEAASRAGRWREAYRCYTEAGDEAGQATVREHLPDYEIYTP
ncbi:MAG: hypothetical protein ACYTEZ_09705 [Planctomycetota bacterium]